MSDSSKNYIHTSKLIEAYSSFFEKLFYSSSNPDQNLDKLLLLKRKLYTNIQSKSKVEEAFPDLFKDHLHQTSAIKSFKSGIPISITSPQLTYLDIQSPKKDVQSLAPFSLDTLQPAPVAETFPDLSPSSRASWGHLDVTLQLLNQIKASTHLEGHNILTVINSFAVFRVFKQPHESTFFALCAGFFENYLIHRLSQTRPSLTTFLISKLGEKNSDIETLSEYLDTQFTAIIKSTESSSLTEEEVRKRFYENLLSNSSLYNSCVLIFKKILGKMLDRKSVDTQSKKMSFQWMNDVNEADRGFFEELAALFEANLHLFIVTSTTFTENSFTPLGYLHSEDPTVSNTQDFSILIDKLTNCSYILYQSKDTFDKILSHLSPIAMAKKPKQRSYTPVAGRYPGARDEHEPPANVEQPKRNLLPPTEEFYKFSPRSAGRLKKPNSMAGESPLIQISDLLRNFPQVPHATAYLHPIETHPKPEDTFSFNQRIELAAKEDANSSPSNRPKEYEAGTNHLLPKGKDMSPTRKKENEFLQSPSSLADRIMEEINQKIKADKAEKQYVHHIDVSSPAIRGKEHSAEKGSYNTYGDLSEHMKDLNRTPPISEFKYYESKTASTRPLSIDRHMAEISKDMSNISNMSPSSKKPPVLPADLKTKFNNYNKVIDKHNFEFNQVISTHIVKEDQAAETAKALKPVILAPYASMIEKKDQKEGFTTNIGATMQMDS